MLFFIHLESRRVDIAGTTVHPDEPWMKQMARNVTMEGCGALRDCRYLIFRYTQDRVRGQMIADGAPPQEQIALHFQDGPKWISGGLNCRCKLVMESELAPNFFVSKWANVFPS